MRQGGPNDRRPRGRHHSGRNGGGGGQGGGSHNHSQGQGMGGNRPRSAASLRHQTFDSNCIDVRVRGNAWQVHEKYQALARDAQSSGDRVMAEHYYQHAEHYYRIIEAINEATAAEQRQRPTPAYGQQPDVPANYYGADGNLAAQPNGNMTAPPATGDANQGQPAMAQAEVQLRNQPQPSAFFAAEEAEEQSVPEPLVANR